MSHATLIGAKLHRTTLINTNFNNANLTKAEILGSTIVNIGLNRESKLISIALSENTISDCDLSNLTFAGVSFFKSEFTRVNFSGSQLVEADFTEATFTEVNFTGANLRYADFSSVTLSGANLSGAILTNAFLDNAELAGADLSDVDLTDVNLDGVDLTHTRLPLGYVQDTDASMIGEQNNLNLPTDSIQFDTLDIDESKLPGTCFDYVMQEDSDIIEQLLENIDFFVLVFPSDKEDFKVICKTREEIKLALNDISSIFYECTGRFKRDTLPDGRTVELRDKVIGPIDETPYVKILGVGGINIFIDIKEVNALLNSTERIFYAYPKKEITHSISWNNIYGRNPDYISAYHCQNGSNLTIYTLKVCKGDCVISNHFRV
jgi:uncharacterized protein YjbI with pentapeptide repeats